MELCHTDIFLHSPAAQRLAEYIQKRRKKWVEQPADFLIMDDFEGFEQDLHALVMAVECEMVGEELGRHDISAKEIEVDGKVYSRSVSLSETYLTAAGRVKVERHLYYSSEHKGESICPLELRSGIVAGYFTPRAARQGAFAMAHLTAGESEAMLGEIGNMQPSRSSLDRLTKALSPHWEAHRADWEAQLRQAETVPGYAKVLAISVDGVMAPMRGADKQEKAEQPGKHASGPTGYKEVGCGTVSLYDQEAARLQTVRYARMPESKKVTLQQQLETEIASVLALSPNLLRIHLADGAKDNWRLMSDIEAHLPTPLEPPIEIVDYYHACDHLKRGCDAAWGESTPESKKYFDRLKTVLKESDNGTKLIIRTLRLQSSTAKGNRRKRLEAELTYFRNQQPRMRYPDYIRLNLPIASGVMEASCKTLVTQRMKRSGMAWAKQGGQAILTLRSLIQSNRWTPAWTLLSADFRKTIKITKSKRLKIRTTRTQPLILSASQPTSVPNYHSLPLAG
jgi:hypothetical protein